MIMRIYNKVNQFRSHSPVCFRERGNFLQNQIFGKWPCKLQVSDYSNKICCRSISYDRKGAGQV